MRPRVQGVAIVLAMGVVALAALTATAIMVSQSTRSRQVELARDHAQAQRMTSAGIDWARAVLGDDGRLGQMDHGGEPWALELPPMPTEQGSVGGRIEDEQGKFNLNDLVSDGKVNVVAMARFERLLKLLSLPDALSGTLADWLDADAVPQPGGGAEDAYYLSRQPAHVAANRPLTGLGELSLVSGYTPSVLARLRPFVTALPRPTPVNINTASPELVAAIIDGLDVDEARKLLAKRARLPFRQVVEFSGSLPAGRVVADEQLSVNSDFFLATVTVTFGDTRAQASALLGRRLTGWPEVVWRRSP